MAKGVYAGGAFIEMTLDGADTVSSDLEQLEQEIKGFERVARTLGKAFGVKIDMKDLKNITVQGDRAKEAAERLAEELKKTGHVGKDVSITTREIKKLDNALDDAGDEAEKLARRADDAGNSVAGIGKRFSKLHYAIRVVRNFSWAIGAVSGSMVQAARDADRLIKASRAIGASFENMQALAFAAEQSGATMDDLSRAMTHMQRNLTLSRLKGGEFAEALQWMKMSADDFAGLSVEEQFIKIADAASRAGSDAGTLVEKLMGESARPLMGMLRGGAGELKAYAQQAKEFGLILDNDQGKAIERMMDAFNIARRVLMSFMQTIAAKLAPVVERAVLWFVAFYKTIFDVQGGVGSLGDTVAWAADWILSAVQVLVRFWQRQWSTMMGVINVFKVGFYGFATTILFVVDEILTGLAKIAKNTGFKHAGEELEQYAAQARRTMEYTKEGFNESWEAAGSHFSDAFTGSFGDKLKANLESLKGLMGFSFEGDGTLTLEPSADMKKVASQMDFSALEYGTEAFARAQKVQMEKQLKHLASIDRKLSGTPIALEF